MHDIMVPHDESLSRQQRIEELEELRGTFADGHTDDDVDSVLADIERLTGLECRVVWDFEDMWGIGGDSELFCYKESTRTLWEVPSALNDFLYDPEAGADVDAADLLYLVPGKYVRRAPSHSCGYNLMRRHAPNSDLG